MRITLQGCIAISNNPRGHNMSDNLLLKKATKPEVKYTILTLNS